VDLHFVREESGLKLGRSTAQIVADNRRRELAVYSDADLVVNVTPEDDGILRHILPSIPTVIVPNIVRSQPRSGRSRERLLFFVGNFKHSPNVDGIVWFGRETWPLITQEFPDARLEIAGSDSSDAVRALADIRGIHLLGWVPETAPCLERAAVSIAPLRFGGGMKGKVTEALAHGLPVVMTSFGAQGFGGRSGEHYWVADDASAFARAVIELLRNPTEAHAMGLRGQALVNQLCSPEAVGRVLKHIPADVMARNRKHVFASRFRVQVGAALEMVGSGIARVGRTVMGLEGPRE
jgi:glycosyltransferase involved in cell wall biosynthesis